MKTELNVKEKEVLDFISAYTKRNGYSPSVRDIATELQIKSTATVHARLQKLTDLGYIRTGTHMKRAIELVGKTHTVDIPMVGLITAGQPILAVENTEGYFPLPENMFGQGDLFMLKVKGDSMINVGIHDGDSIIVKQQSTADNGDIVAAMIDDSATVKQFFKEDGHFRLQPHNDTMSPIICDEVSILGKVVGLIRKI